MRDIIYIVDYETRNRLGVAQLVARYLGVVEAVGSSPVTQTSCNQHYPKIRYSIEYRIFLLTNNAGYDIIIL